MSGASHLYDTCSEMLETGIPIGADMGHLRRRLRKEFPLPDESLRDFGFRFLDRADALVGQPRRLARCFGEHFHIDDTPTLRDTLILLLLLGIEPRPVDYLPTGATNMCPGGVWHIHYSTKDPPATQKFSLFHEVFEILVKTFRSLDSSSCHGLEDPELSRRADRFAAGVLMQPPSFTRRAIISGLDVPLLADELELSQQAVLIGFAEHLKKLPLVGALYEFSPPGLFSEGATTADFVTTVVVKTPPVGRILQLGPRQRVPVRATCPYEGGLDCTVINCRKPLLWYDSANDCYPLILVRPLVGRAGGEPYKVILLAVPSSMRSLLQPQINRVKPLEINGNEPCPVDGPCPWRRPWCP